MKSNPELWGRITGLQIDHGAPQFTFVQRLARENAWHESFANRVNDEYLRFVYLACISDSKVTPSVAVDQAWHLHLCYTRSYWGDLCERILGRPLHHGPTEGGSKEATRFRAQYENTLALYQKEFGGAPPADIWPRSDVRFGEKVNPFWVSRDRFVVFEKIRFQKAATISGIAAASVVGAGAAANGSGSTVFAVLAVIGLLILFWWLSRSGKGGPGSGGSGGGGCGASCGSGCGSSCGSGCGSD